ncbi:MAG: glycosyltransferase family 4 protein [Mariniblastus sp.]|nr:glycosyltransferase family 4 protein [Mariniblastus sp.]
MAKRILMINDHIHFSGGGDAVFRLERQLYHRLGYEVHTFSQAPIPPDGATDQDHVFVESQNRLINKARKYTGSRKVASFFQQTLNLISPDLVRVHLVSKYPLSIYPYLKHYPVIQTLHGPNLFCATSWGNLKKNSEPCEMGVGPKCCSQGCISAASYPLYQQFFSRLTPSVKAAVNLYLCPSRFIESAAKHVGFNPTVHLPLGIDKIFSQVNTRPARFEQPSLLFVGSLVESKGVRYLIEALNLIRKEVPNVMLRICGRGPELAGLKAQTAQSQLETNVKFLGFTEREQLLELYQRSHCLVVPSIWAEQFGLIGPEALASQTPVVASEVGGIPEWLVEGKSGFLVQPRNPQQIAEKTVKILKSESMMEQFGEFGRQFVLEHFSCDQYEIQLELLLKEKNFGCGPVA